MKEFSDGNNHEEEPSSDEGFAERARMTYEEEQAASEREAILENPDYFGLGEMEVIDGRVNIDTGKLCEEYGVEPELAERIKKEKIKACIEKYKKVIDSFGGKLKRARVCTVPDLSPFCLKNSRRGEGIELSPVFVDQVKYMKQSGVSEINLVASFADGDVGDKASMDLPIVDEYVEMIDKMLDQVGEEGIIVSIGNETNATIDSAPGEDGSVFPICKRIPPEEYGAFYREVVGRLKQKYPGARFCTAGTAFCAPKYMAAMLDAIGDDGLIDVVDFHPYRNEVDEAWVGDGETELPGWSYGDYEDELLRIAKSHGAELTIGEVQFGGGDDPMVAAKARVGLREALRRSAEKGIKSNVWPRVGLPF